MNRYSVRFEMFARIALFFIIALNTFLFTRNIIADKLNVTDWIFWLAVLLVMLVVYLAIRLVWFKYYIVVKDDSMVIRNVYWTRVIDLAQIEAVIIEAKFEEIREIKIKSAKGIVELRLHHSLQDEWKKFVCFLSASGISVQNV